MTKEFKRDDLLFSLCGLNCSLCPMYVRKLCTGCIKDSICYEICNIVPCSLEHGVIDYCFECEEYPCSKYDEVDQHDSLMTHINQLTDMEKAKNMGIEKYNMLQHQKVDILNIFLENYNPGNNKEVFYCTAVNLLPLDDLIDLTDNLDNLTDNMSLEEKYTYIKNKLFDCAKNNRIKIELRKEKYNNERISFD